MKILVTGGKGFLGSHLVDLLVDDGHDVVVVDNEVSSVNYKNPQVVYIKKRIEDFKTNEIFDEVYHLASPASPPIYQKYPFLTISANTVGTIRAIELGKKILFASTSEVYGSPIQHPQREDYWGNVNTLGPRACYDNSKRLGETICWEYNRKGKDVRIVRIFNTYGAGMNPNDGRVLVNFVNQIKNNKPLTIYGDGSQTRSFCYVSDTVWGMIMAMRNGKSGEVYNIGNPEEVSIKEIAEIIISIFNKKHYPIDYLPLPQDDPPKRCPDITKAKKELGWKPEINLEKGLELLIRGKR